MNALNAKDEDFSKVKVLTVYPKWQYSSAIHDFQCLIQE
jgi:hypothetical protein